MLSVTDIKNIKFSNSMNGYKKEEVEILLDKILPSPGNEDVTQSQERDHHCSGGIDSGFFHDLPPVLPGVPVGTQHHQLGGENRHHAAGSAACPGQCGGNAGIK